MYTSYNATYQLKILLSQLTRSLKAVKFSWAIVNKQISSTGPTTCTLAAQLDNYA